MAVNHGFQLIISAHNKNGKVKYLRCARGERYRPRVALGEEDVERRGSKTKACGCPFKISVRQTTTSTWKIKISSDPINSTHNHVMIVYPQGHRQMSGLSPASKVIVADLTRAQVKPCAILASLQEKFKEDHVTRKHVYNYRSKLRTLSFEGRDVASQFLHLARQNKYVVRLQSDQETNQMTHVFLARRDSLQLFRTYGWVVGMDSTYKTNK